MIPQPRKTRHKKHHKGRLTYTVKIKQDFWMGDYAIVSLESAQITAKQIAAIELAIKRKIKRGGKIWKRVFPHTPVTKKPLEVRMGKGKGSVSYWATRIQPGSFILELSCINDGLALSALRVAQSKLPVKTVLYKRTKE